MESETYNGDPVAYRYDPNDNRTEKTEGFQGGAQSTFYDYMPQSNRLEAVDNQLIILDDAGNLIQDQQGRSYAYNDAGRLKEIQENGQILAQYRYNQAGQRTHKITPTQTTIYHYDLTGNLIAETKADGTLVKDYLWQNGTPIAQIDVNGTGETLTYLHTDHLNTPRLATDPNRTLVWRWEGEAFGNTPPQESGVTVNLRFPGQYYDSESGLHYNWNRYYDPETGRYITSDPIGLDGGLNSYGYALQNPIRYTDPTGQFVPLGALALAGGGSVTASGGIGGLLLNLTGLALLPIAIDSLTDMMTGSDDVIPFPPDSVANPDNTGPADPSVPIPDDIPQICKLIKETPGNELINGICLYQCPDGTRSFLEKNVDCGEQCPPTVPKLKGI